MGGVNSSSDLEPIKAAASNLVGKRLHTLLSKHKTSKRLQTLLSKHKTTLLKHQSVSQSATSLSCVWPPTPTTNVCNAAYHKFLQVRCVGLCGMSMPQQQPVLELNTKVRAHWRRSLCDSHTCHRPQAAPAHVNSGQRNQKVVQLPAAATARPARTTPTCYQHSLASSINLGYDSDARTACINR